MINQCLRERNQRHIIQRIIVRGLLVLDTPTCLGSGDTEGDIDLVILRDSLEDKALLMGSSIAGALRNYLRDYEYGYNADEISVLFGGQRSEKEGEQSPLIINDALSNTTPHVELRDGVKINSISRTAEDRQKYDLELLEAGTQFDFCFELLIENNREQLIKELVIVLQGLENGAISIGMKKQRGFGRCHVKEWQVWQFDLQKYDDRIAWLTFPHWTTGFLTEYRTYKSIADTLSVHLDEKDKRDRLTINATFTLATPLLIRSGQASSDKAPDVVHLKSRRDGELQPVLSGTSLAGVLRHRAERIVNTLHKNTSIIDEIFGVDFSKNKTKKATASRLIVHESIIKETTDLVQNRIAINRFTGGALHGALFNEQPIFGNDKTELNLELELRQPKPHEIGLLLLLIKDLWTGDLPVGGTSSVGRGRLQGKEAIITLASENKIWKITQGSKDEPLTIDNAEDLEKFVDALNEEVAA
ncbi:RAMP superfamily CRISPR-associated protein [Anabaena sp. CCY 9402-a]|uniref:RAMP superfamily CRISPR-associated protein n=1 Tax=Anabaena sp. CCY 9402-a TaxID=3103867 RepID=UPI0039C761D4